MADRTWNPIDARLYEEDWSSEARLVLGVLIARCPNPYGVYEIPTLILKTLFTPEQIKSALKELSEMDSPPIKLYRGDRVVWIIKKWNRAGIPSENHCKGAFNEVHEHYQEVWKDFRDHYIRWLRGFKGVPIPLLSESDTDSESDPETDSKKKEKKGKKGGKPPAPPDSRFMMMVAELFPDMKSNDAMLGAKTLAKIYEIDFMKDDTDTKNAKMNELMKALRWAAHDKTSFWNGTNFSNCKTLRDRKHGAGTPMKYENILSDYNKAQADVKGGMPKYEEIPD